MTLRVRFKEILLLLLMGLLAVELAGCAGVGASKSGGNGSNPGGGGGATTAPAVPGGLQATAGNGQVSLAWTGSAGATSYHVKRATVSGGPYTQVAAPT